MLLRFWGLRFAFWEREFPYIGKDKCLASVTPWFFHGEGERANSNSEENPCILIPCVFGAWEIQCLASVTPWFFHGEGERANSNSEENPCILIPCVFGAWEIQSYFKNEKKIEREIFLKDST
jgi:hypothetical protein